MKRSRIIRLGLAATLLLSLATAYWLWTAFVDSAAQRYATGGATDAAPAHRGVEAPGAQAELRERDPVASARTEVAAEGVPPASAGATAGAWLHVRSAVTGVDLKDVEVVAVPGTRDELGERPRKAAIRDGTVLQGVDSPVAWASVEVAAEHEFHGFVRAAGHAWRRIRCARGDELTVHLPPAGDLAIDLRSGDEHAYSMSVFAPGRQSSSVSAMLEDGESFLATALTPGRYHVEARRFRGTHFAAPHPPDFAAQVDVAAGERASLRFDLTEAPDGDVDPVDVVVELAAEGWDERGSTRVELVYVGADARRTIERRAKAELTARGDWLEGEVEFSGLAPGDYAIGLEGFGFATELNLRTSGRRRIVIGPPQETLVRCLDRSTGAPLELRNLKVWSSGVDLPAEIDRGRFQRYRGEGQHLVRAVPGRWTLELAHADHGVLRTAIECRSGATELTAEFDLPPVVRAEFLVDGRPSKSRRYDSDLLNVVPAESTGGRLDSLKVLRGEVELRVTEPGRYRLEVTQPRGMLPVDDILLDLRAGECTDLRIELHTRG